jgi:hypothetical protein
VSLNENGVCSLVIVIFFGVLLVIQILLIFTVFFSFLSKRVINQNVIQVFQLFETIHSLVLVSLITLIARQNERVIGHVENLQVIFEVL